MTCQPGEPVFFPCSLVPWDQDMVDAVREGQEHADRLFGPANSEEFWLQKLDRERPPHKQWDGSDG